MTIQIDLQPDVERGLLAQARLHGVSLEEYVRRIVTREVNLSDDAPRTAANLVEASKAVRGLLTDEEVDTLFRRNPSNSRPADFE
jgi:hypothetical protein